MGTIAPTLDEYDHPVTSSINFFPEDMRDTVKMSTVRSIAQKEAMRIHSFFEELHGGGKRHCQQEVILME